MKPLRVLFAATAVVAVAAATACTSAHGPTAKPAQTGTSSSAAGSALHATFGVPYAVTVASPGSPTETYNLTVTKPTVTSQPLTQYGPTPAQSHFVTFYVTFSQPSEGSTYNAAYFYVRTASGAHVNTDAAFSMPNALTSGTMHAGEQVSGTIAADVASTHGTLVYEPVTVAGGSAVEYTF